MTIALGNASGTLTTEQIEKIITTSWKSKFKNHIFTQSLNRAIHATTYPQKQKIQNALISFLKKNSMTEFQTIQPYTRINALMKCSFKNLYDSGDACKLTWLPQEMKNKITMSLDIPEKLGLLNSIPVIGQSIWVEIRENKSQLDCIHDALHLSILAVENLSDASTKINAQASIKPNNSDPKIGYLQRIFKL